MIGFLMLSLMRQAPLSPWITYEAEAMHTSGTVVGPVVTGWSAAREASGRQYLDLKPGQSLTFLSKESANGMVVRFSLPVSDPGQDFTGNLSIDIRHSQINLPLTNRFTHQFGAFPFTKIPSEGNHRNFWDEARILTNPIAAGDSVTIRVPEGSPETLIDLVDLELVPPAPLKPDGALSVADFGAKPSAGEDVTKAFTEALRQSEMTGRTVWVPPGEYIIKGTILLNNVKLQGAGMWRTTLVGTRDYRPENRLNLYGNGNNITVSDLAISGQLTYRNDSEPNDGIGGSFGTGSAIRNLWIEHTKAGAWLTNSDGLLVEGCRFRDTRADGINPCLGMHATTVRNCSARGTGDDGFAMWPATYATSTFEQGGNIFQQCIAETPYLAQAFSIYGGNGNRVVDCTAKDIPYGAGAMVSSTFPTVAGFSGTTLIRNMWIVRAGDQDGALAIVSNLRDISGLQVADIDISNAVTSAIKFTSFNEHGLVDALFNKVTVRGAASFGIGFSPAAVGKATVSYGMFENCLSGPIGPRPDQFKLSMVH